MVRAASREQTGVHANRVSRFDKVFFLFFFFFFLFFSLSFLSFFPLFIRCPVLPFNLVLPLPARQV